MKTKIHIHLCKINIDKCLFLLNNMEFDNDYQGFVRVWDNKHKYYFLRYEPLRKEMELKFCYSNLKLESYEYLKYRWEEIQEDEN